MILAVALVPAGLLIATLVRHDPARPVDVSSATRHYRSQGLQGPGDNRPAPGVYLFTGSGTDRLSLPALTQPEGPSMPVTVTLSGSGCWTLRIDYSTHHWQSWDYCRRGEQLLHTGGAMWSLWQVGPLNITNRTALTCSPAEVVVPASLSTGDSWPLGCTGTSTAVKGQMTSAGTIRYLGDTTVRVGGKDVAVHHFLQTQTDSGSQQGTERYETWLQVTTGLPVRMQQDIEVRTSTPFGDSTYTQTSNLTLTSLQPRV